MRESPPAPARSKRIYVYWGTALTLLIAAGLFSWLVVVPVMRINGVLRKHQPPRGTIAYRGVPSYAEAAIRDLGGPDRAAVSLDAYLRLPNWAAKHRGTAAGLLQHCGRGGARVLARLLADEDESMRLNVAAYLGYMGAEAEPAVPALIAALGDARSDIRLNSTSALGRIGTKAFAAVPALLTRLDDPEAYVRARAAWAVGEVGAKDKAIPALERALKDTDPDVRQAAAEALKKIRAAQEKAVSDVPIYSSSNLSGHAVAPEWLGGDKATEQDVKLRSLKTHGEVISNPKRRNVYVNAIGHKKFVERFPSGKPLRLGRYRYAAHVQLPLSPKADLKQKTNPQAVHTMIQFWDGRNALYKSNRATLEGAIYWDINPWTAQEFGKIKVYTHPVKLVDTGIRLRPDTSWHRFELVIDLEAQRYVSVTIDDQTRDLSNMRLARVKHADWGRDVALTITTESLASWSKDGGAAFTWTTRFRDISFFEDRPASSDLPNQPDSGDADVSAPAPSPREPVKRSRRIPPLLGFAGGVLVGAACFVAVIMIWGWSPMPAEIEPTVVTALMDYAKAQTAYRKKDWNGDGKHTYAKTLKELSDAGLIPEEMAEASGPNGKPYRGYLYLECRTIGEVPINWADDFAICAIPARYGKDGYRTFVVATHETIFGFDQGPKTDFVRDHPQNPTAAGWIMDCDERPSRP